MTPLQQQQETNTHSRAEDHILTIHRACLCRNTVYRNTEKGVNTLKTSISWGLHEKSVRSSFPRLLSLEKGREHFICSPGLFVYNTQIWEGFKRFQFVGGMYGGGFSPSLSRNYLPSLCPHWQRRSWTNCSLTSVHFKFWIQMSSGSIHMY